MTIHALPHKLSELSADDVSLRAGLDAYPIRLSEQANPTGRAGLSKIVLTSWADDQYPVNTKRKILVSYNTKSASRAREQQPSTSFSAAVRQALAELSTSLYQIGESEVDSEVRPQAAGKYTQLSIPFDFRFSPSLELVQLWQNGVVFHTQNESGKPSLETLALTRATSANRSEWQSHFSDRLYGLLISRARRARGSTARTLVFIDANQNFEDRLELSLSDAFPIRPREISRFLSELARQLLAHFSGGNEFKGSWGGILIKDQQLVAQLTAREAASYPKIVPAQRLQVDL